MAKDKKPWVDKSESAKCNHNWSSWIDSDIDDPEAKLWRKCYKCGIEEETTK